MMDAKREKRKVWTSWSSGKDSSFALYVLMRNPEYSDYEVTGLFTSVTDPFNRVAMHSVREELLDEQAKKLGLPLYKMRIPYPCPNEVYEERMRALVEAARNEGVDTFVFGDLFLEDVRSYRVAQLANSGIEPLFPLWGRNTKQLATEMIRDGLRAVLTCVDEKRLDPGFSGKEFDFQFLRSLPEGIDPCGENGEFHTFVHDCPLFAGKIRISIGEMVSRDGFSFTDLRLDTSTKEGREEKEKREIGN